jgi:hypothetical protein
MEPSTTPPNPNLRLVVVFRTSNLALCAVAKSILQAASVKYMVRGETLANLVGGWADSDDQSNHEVEFLVREADAEWARELLADVRPAPTHSSGM